MTYSHGCESFFGLGSIWAGNAFFYPFQETQFSLLSGGHLSVDFLLFAGQPPPKSIFFVNKLFNMVKTN
jgi:hypothetical protein